DRAPAPRQSGPAYRRGHRSTPRRHGVARPDAGDKCRAALRARRPALRLAGEAAVPFTSGILIGIGETRRERVEALLALRELHECYGHLQEIIVQNFRAKPATRMAESEDAPLAEQLWTIAAARLVLGGAMNIQAPPNL